MSIHTHEGGSPPPPPPSDPGAGAPPPSQAAGNLPPGAVTGEAPPPPPPADPPPPPPAAGTSSTGNADPRGPDAIDTERNVSTGKRLGDQIDPATMTSEDDGNRTLARPRTDPGPVRLADRVNVPHPDRKRGEHRYSDVKADVPILTRESTGHSQGFGKHDGEVTAEIQMPPDTAVGNSVSDVYHPERGKGITDRARERIEERSAKGREPALPS